MWLNGSKVEVSLKEGKEKIPLIIEAIEDELEQNGNYLENDQIISVLYNEDAVIVSFHESTADSIFNEYVCFGDDHDWYNYREDLRNELKNLFYSLPNDMQKEISSRLDFLPWQCPQVVVEKSGTGTGKTELLSIKDLPGCILQGVYEEANRRLCQLSELENAELSPSKKMLEDTIKQLMTSLNKEIKSLNKDLKIKCK